MLYEHHITESGPLEQDIADINWHTSKQVLRVISVYINWRTDPRDLRLVLMTKRTQKCATKS